MENEEEQEVLETIAGIPDSDAMDDSTPDSEEDEYSEDDEPDDLELLHFIIDAS